MAEDGSGSSNSIIIRNKLECALCNKRLKNPKILPCLHSVCEKCMVKQESRSTFYNSWSLTCPLCKQTTTFSNGVQDVKTNFHLIGQLEDTLVKEELLTEEFGQPVCQSCDLEKEAVSRCLDCSMYLCLSCKTVHRRIAVLSKHTVATLDELRLGEVTKTFRRQKKVEECQNNHRFFCETCNDVICKDCPKIDPRNGKIFSGWRGASQHKIIEMESAASTKRKMTKQMISNLQKVLGNYESTLKSIAADRAKMEGQSNELEEQVKEAVREITKKVEEEEARLLKQIANIQQEKQKTLQESEKNLKAAMQRMSDSLEMAIDVTDSSSDQDFLGLVSLIHNNLEVLISKRPDRIYNGLPRWRFIRESSGCIGNLSGPRGPSYNGFGQYGSCAEQVYSQAISTDISRKCSPLKRVPIQPRLPSKFLQKSATVSATTAPSTTSCPEAPKFTFTKPSQLLFSFGQTSSAAVVSKFTLKPRQPPSVRLSPTKQSPVTTGVKASSSSQAPMAGFSFGHRIRSLETQSHGNSWQQVFASKKEEDDDVIFISEKLPTADQRARAERLLLPPTFFLYEDDPPCPGCRGCEEEDLAQRGIQLSKLPLAAGKSAAVTSAAVTPAAVFGRAALDQKTYGSVATPSTFEAKDYSRGAPSFGTAGPSLSFASLSSDKQGFFAGKGTKGFAFAQAGAEVNGGGGDDTAGGDEKHDPHYDPIVPLPELVDTKTSEEDEQIMYKQRARLYRYAKELNVWKEQGIGEVKLMRHKESGGLRLLMRREQVLKLCANHRITHDIKLEILKASDRTWVWHALDYSKDEPCHEQFAIKFKTPELAVEFKRRFEELQAERTRELEVEKEDEAVVPEGPRGDQPEKDDDIDKKDGKDGVAAEATVPNTEPTTEELIAKYQPKPGSWQCDACLVNNEETALTCVSCTTPKPGAAAPSATQQLSTLSKLAGASRQNQSVPSSGRFVFRAGSLSSQTPKSSAPPALCKSIDATTHSDEQGKDKQDATTHSDEQGEDKQDATTQGDDKSTVKPSDPSISQSFSDLLRNAIANHAQKQKEMTLAESSPGDEEAAGGSKDDSVSEERDDIHFDPIVQLPEQLEKITGEEDENQLFCSRSKLYRFDKTSSQWKDRGIGDIKILQNVKTRRYRILMRREAVFRVCANHSITKNMALHPNAGSENSLVWHAMDASDGDPQPEQLAVRFKLAGTAQRFKTTFEECQAELRKLDDIGTEQANEVSSTTEES